MSASHMVEESKWRGVHTFILAAFCVGTAIEAYVYSLPYIAESWVNFPKSLLPLFTVWSPLWLLLGGLLVGPISDNLGRKKAFYFTTTLYIVGGVLLFFASNYQSVLASLSLLLFSAGGEYHNILVATHELVPRKNRSASIFLVVNSTNLGGIIAAALSAANYTSPHTQRVVLSTTLVLVAISILIIRTHIPESIMWLEAKGKKERAILELEKYYGRIAQPSREADADVAHTPLWFRAATGSILGWAYTAGFSLLVLALGPYFFPNLTDEFIIVSSAAAFFSGFVGFVADRVTRKRMLLFSSLATITTSYLFLPTQGMWLAHPQLFWLLFIPLSAFINLYFLTEDALKSEFWPSEKRGLYTAIVRTASLGGTIPILLYASILPITQYFYLGLIVFAAGVAASTIWYRYGEETGKKTSVTIWSNKTGAHHKLKRVNM
ncbi:MAG: MFS transporter [Thermoprotei archaeon]